MLSGDIDLAVHSLKDMPTELPEGLMPAAITTRAGCRRRVCQPLLQIS